MKQSILTAKNNYSDLNKLIESNDIENIFVVCLNSIEELKIYHYLKSLKGIKVTYFSDFNPNPTYESVCNGIRQFKNSKSNHILAIGGGSALDVAKCIKMFSTLDDNQNYLMQTIQSNDIKLWAVPTTAGTGSEATKFAVIYYNGEKQSVMHESCIPSTVLFDPSLLESLPLYQKKATALDALCHSMESMWSVNSNSESKKYSKKAIELINKNLDLYLNGDSSVNDMMLFAANSAGKAINIAQTTAGHAMCYKLTSLYGISHGHAAAIVNSELLPFMIYNIDKCSDKRGKEYLRKVFFDLARALNLNTIKELGEYLKKLLEKLNLYDININYNDIELLVESVNITRLKNNPIELSKRDIKDIYLCIFKQVEKRRKKNGSK